MYAAAGGASLASRQARQRQRQQKKNQQLQAKLHPQAKLSPLSITEHATTTPTRSQSRQFHQLPTNYLRTPHTEGRKLSATYTTQSKLLLPIDESDSQSVAHMRAQYTQAHSQMHHSHSHSHHPTPFHPYPLYQSGHNSHGGISTHKLAHRNSGSCSASNFQRPKLSKSATATLPLVSQIEATPPTTPSGAAEAAIPTEIKTGTIPAIGHSTISTCNHDTIIVTPATPMASPGHVGKATANEQQGALVKNETCSSPSAVIDDEDQIKYPPAHLERKCSVYRMRRNAPYQYHEGGLVDSVTSNVRRQFKDLQYNQQEPQYEPLLSNESYLCYKGLPNRRKLQLCAYCEEGICVCEHIECTRGRAAWQERRRCSVQEAQQQAACHRRWVKRNRVQDASFAGSSDDEDILGVLRGPSTFANTFLYVGLGTIALGLVIAFVGTGEKGFKTVELRLIGPSLIGLGFVCCMLRILFCICPSHCISTQKKKLQRNCDKFDADYTTSLLRGEIKRVPTNRRSGFQTKYPLAHKRHSNKMLNEGMEALRQIATTSLFMQNEQKPSLNRVVPIIKEPASNTGDTIPNKAGFVSGDGTAQRQQQDGMYNEISSSNERPSNEQHEKPLTDITTVASYSSKQCATIPESTTAGVSPDETQESATNALTNNATCKLSRLRISINQAPLPQLTTNTATAAATHSTTTSDCGVAASSLNSGTPATETPATPKEVCAGGNRELQEMQSIGGGANERARKFNFLVKQRIEADRQLVVVNKCDSEKLHSSTPSSNATSCAVFAFHSLSPATEHHQTSASSVVASKAAQTTTTIAQNSPVPDTATVSCSDGNNSTNSITHNQKYTTPEVNQTLNLFEPELVLSPAKLGQ